MGSVKDQFFLQCDAKPEMSQYQYAAYRYSSVRISYTRRIHYQTITDVVPACQCSTLSTTLFEKLRCFGLAYPFRYATPRWIRQTKPPQITWIFSRGVSREWSIEMDTLHQTTSNHLNFSKRGIEAVAYRDQWRRSVEAREAWASLGF